MDPETREALERVILLARVFVDNNLQDGEENHIAIATAAAWLDTFEAAEEAPSPPTRQEVRRTRSRCGTAIATANRTDDTGFGVRGATQNHQG